MSNQVVGEVKAYQADDSQLVWENVQPHRNWNKVRSSTGGSSAESWAMGESLTLQEFVREASESRKALSGGKIMTVPQPSKKYWPSLCQQPR